MANNYLEFSEALVVKNDIEASWVVGLVMALRMQDPRLVPQSKDMQRLAKVILKEVGSEDAYITANITHDEDMSCWVHFYDDGDNPDPYVIGRIVQEFIRKFRKGQGFNWSMQWSERCDKARVGEFGGGVVLVNELELDVVTTGDVVASFDRTGVWSGFVESKPNPKNGTVPLIKQTSKGKKRK